MRKVLAIIHTPVFGGPHNQLIQLHKGLMEQGWAYRAVLPVDEGDGAARLVAAGVPVTQIPLHRPRASLSPGQHAGYLGGFADDVRRIQQIIRNEKIDLVQICGLMNPQGAIAARREGIPVVWQLLSTFAPWPIRLFFAPFVIRYADVVMSTGTTVFRRHPGINLLKQRLVPFFPPVDLEKMDALRIERGTVRSSLELEDGICLCGTLGNRNRQKGHQYFVKAAELMTRQEGRIKTCIVGRHTPSSKEWYERHVVSLAEQLNLLDSGKMVFLDPPTEARRFVAAMDVFVLSSIAEGIPTAAMEAMALGVPVVATDVGAIGELVKDGFNGFIVPPRSPERLAEKCLLLARDASLREGMGTNARRFIQDFGLQRCMEQHVIAFRKACGI